jgi:hypothetical protein
MASRWTLAELTTSIAVIAVTSGRVWRTDAALDERTGGDYQPILSITFYGLCAGYGDFTIMENRPRR